MKKQGAKTAVPRLRFLEFRGDKEWATQQLGEACELYQPETIPSSSFMADGSHLVYGAGGIIGRLDRFNHLHAEVIIGCRGICGNASLTQPKSWITGNAMVIRPAGDQLLKGFLFHSLDAADLSPVISGSAQPQITRQGLKRFPVSVPARAEQQKIADCLTSLDEVIAAQGRKVDALKAHKRGLMQQLFPREGETRPRLRFPEFRNAPEWELGTLGDVCEVLNNRRVPISSSDRRPGSFPYYGASGVVDFVDHFIFDERLLLVGEDGAKWGAFEETAFIAEGKYWVNNHAHVLKPVKVIDTLLASYLTMLDLASYVSGHAPPKLTLGKLKSIAIVYPESLSEQQRIADCLSSLDARITAETRQLAALKTHKQGLMQQLFPVPEVG